MNKNLIIFLVGILLIGFTVLAVFFGRNYFAKADTSLEPTNIKLRRLTPTAGEVSFTTAKAATASIECSTSANGPFSLCGAETLETTSHIVKTSIILNPEKDYHFKIKIGERTYDNIGLPFLMSRFQGSGQTGQVGESPNTSGAIPRAFPSSLLGVCQGNSQFDADYDINKDGCIRQNDWDLFGR